MKIKILGSGTMLSDSKRNPSGYLIEHNEHFAVLDFGPGILRQLKSLPVNLLSIQTVFISHFHLDHCADLFPFLMNRFLMDKTANSKLTIYGPAGLSKWFKTISKTQGEWLEITPPVINEITNKTVTWAGMNIYTQRTFHTKESIAYRFSSQKSLFYSGDTDYQPALIEFAKKSNLAFLECSMPDEQKQQGHLTPSEAGRFASLAKFERLVLTHIYPVNDKPDLKQNVSKYFSGEITIAEDFMEIYL